MRRLYVFLLVVLSILEIYAESLTLKVVEKESGEVIPFAAVTAEYKDSIVSGITDEAGIYSFTPLSLPVDIKVNSFGMNSWSGRINAFNDTVFIVGMESAGTRLQELTVTGRLTRQTDSGISYNMSANKRAQQENSLQALSYVPLVSVTPEGMISVQGSPSYSLYLNGRPYDMAQTSPKVFLESLPASDIMRVEVITRPDNKYGADNRYILNIVLKQPMLDGYVVNLGGGGSTQPTADGSFMGMIRRNRVNAAISYKYGFNGQHDQPTDITYTERDAQNDVSHIWKNDLKGNGSWHTHTIRAMMKWEIDSVNSIYGDAHGEILRNNFTTHAIESEIFPELTEPLIRYTDRSHYTSGAAEANIIYRNYFRDAKTTERFTLGYRYTYNPDKRDIFQNIEYGSPQAGTNRQRTSGGLNAHSGVVSYLLRPAAYQTVRFTLTENYRAGHTESFYSDDGSEERSGLSMRYRNNIVGLKAAYSGWVKRVYCQISLQGDYDYISMKLPSAEGLDYIRRRFYLLPSATFFWYPQQENVVMLSYAATLTRPGIEMLNPFESSSNQHSASKGNPNLKAQYNHDVNLMWYWTQVNNLVLVAGLQYGFMDNLILQDYSVEAEKMIYSYSNFGKAHQIEGSFDIRYNPKNWLSFSINGGVGKRWLSSEHPMLRQDNIFYRITPRIDFYLPNHFRMGGHYGLYKNLPDPWSSRSSLSLYSIYVSKSFVKGRLNVTLTANSPFTRYNLNHVHTSLPTMEREQNNYITARSFGVNISYSFGGGKRVNVERDRSLETKDISTGVR